MGDATSKWTIQTADGAPLAEKLRPFVEAWLEGADGDLLRALVFAARDAAAFEAGSKARLGPQDKLAPGGKLGKGLLI